MSTEAAIQRAILNRIGSMPDCRLFRNTVGVGFVGKPPGRRISFGLAPGSADLIGIHQYTIKPEDVGHKVGVFLSIEVKNPNWCDVRENQVAWGRMIDDMGGVSMIVDDIDDAIGRVLDFSPVKPVF